MNHQTQSNGVCGPGLVKHEGGGRGGCLGKPLFFHRVKEVGIGQKLRARNIFSLKILGSILQRIVTMHDGLKLHHCLHRLFELFVTLKIFKHVAPHRLTCKIVTSFLHAYQLMFLHVILQQLYRTFRTFNISLFCYFVCRFSTRLQN